jgi:hypothetical protein
MKKVSFMRLPMLAASYRNMKKIIPPFLLEMQVAIFGIETFEVHLRGQHFKLFIDHKPLEKLDKVHSKMLNGSQQMMNLFSFKIIYKKGDKIPADFLSHNAVDVIKFELAKRTKRQNSVEFAPEFTKQSAA